MSFRRVRLDDGVRRIFGIWESLSFLPPAGENSNSKPGKADHEPSTWIPHQRGDTPEVVAAPAHRAEVEVDFHTSSGSILGSARL